MKLGVDFHCHPFEALGFPGVNASSVWQICNQAKKNGLDALAVTEHHGPQIAARAREVAQREGIDLLIIPGQEIEVASFHVVELYLHGRRLRILAHPLEPPPDGILVDAIEIASAKGRFDSPVVKAYASQHNIPLVTNSDAHYLHEIGCYMNFVDLEDFFSRGAPLAGDTGSRVTK